ncbi:MAG: 3-oxoacyl-ACP reductase [Leptonema sp. (in: bacteria)]
MKDLLLQISKDPFSKQIASSIGIPLPYPLKRYEGQWKERMLENKVIRIGGLNHSKIHEVISLGLFTSGAKIILDESIKDLVKDNYENIKNGLGGILVANEEKPNALVFDATQLKKVEDLFFMYEFFHNQIRSLESNGRIIIIAKEEEDQKDLESYVVSRSIEGFMRSIAKEIGKKGSTANLIYTKEKSEERITGVLIFLLSELSVYVDGQVIRVSNLVKPPEKTSFYRSLDRKKILITGAARGIGEKTSEIIANEGGKVIVLDHPSASADLGKVAERLNGYPILTDLNDLDSLPKIIEEIKAKVGPLDGIVYNAGITRDKTIGNMKKEQWDQVLRVNLKSILVMHSLLTDSLLNDFGHIVCVSSVSGIAGNFGQSNYATSKAGLIGFVKYLSKELSKKGITINAIAPGFIETKMTEAMPFFIREAGRRLNNLSQGGRPEDVAQLITFLISPLSYGITGQVIRVCGGALIGA